MSRFTTYLTYRAWCSLKYCYICELCNAKSEVIESTLEQFMQHVCKTRSQRPVSLDVGKKSEEIIEKKLFHRIDALKKSVLTVLNNSGSTINAQDKSVVAKSYNEVFKQGSFCQTCGKLQSWYPAFSKPVEKKPGIEWGENRFELVDASNDEAGTYVEQKQIITKTWIFDAGVNPDAGRLLDLLAQNNHLNIIKIYGYTESPLQMPNSTIKIFDVSIEDLEGVTFKAYTRRGVEDAVLWDLILQLLDGLEFLHNLTPPVTLNEITSDDIFIGRQNRLVLTNFTKAKLNASTKKDIETIGEIIQSTQIKYRRKYWKVIRKCRSAHSVAEVRECYKHTMISHEGKTLLFAMILIVCAVAILVMLLVR